MPVSTSQLDTDLDHMTQDWPSTVTWNANDYLAIVTDIEKGSTLDIAVDFDDIDLRVVIRTSIIADEDGRPAEGDAITIADTSYQIIRVTTSADDVSLTLQCAELTA